MVGLLLASCLILQSELPLLPTTKPAAPTRVVVCEIPAGSGTVAIPPGNMQLFKTKEILSMKMRLGWELEVALSLPANQSAGPALQAAVQEQCEALNQQIKKLQSDTVTIAAADSDESEDTPTRSMTIATAKMTSLASDVTFYRIALRSPRGRVMGARAELLASAWTEFQNYPQLATAMEPILCDAAYAQPLTDRPTPEEIAKCEQAIVTLAQNLVHESQAQMPDDPVGQSVWEERVKRALKIKVEQK